jgi:hypothetical protein
MALCCFGPKKLRVLSVLTIAAGASCAGILAADREEKPSATPAAREARSAPATNPALQPVNVKFMVRSYCVAGSRVKDPNALGGFGSSDNFPFQVPAKLKTEPDKLSLKVALDEPLPFGRSHQGFAVYLINRSGKRAAFRACDSRLSIIQEAKDAKGVWKPIEYVPSSWCGNSYHSVFLDSGECWRFAAPRYVGSLKTRVRFAMMLDKEQTIRSEEFDGSINPEQFTVKQGHKPTDIMDPYLE